MFLVDKWSHVCWISMWKTWHYSSGCTCIWSSLRATPAAYYHLHHKSQFLEVGKTDIEILVVELGIQINKNSQYFETSLPTLTLHGPNIICIVNGLCANC